MIGSLLTVSLLLTSSIPAVDNTPSTDRVVLNQKIQELLDKGVELENKKKALIEEERQRILNSDLVLERQTAFKKFLNELSDKTHELINAEKEFTKTFASVLDKMDSGGEDYVSLRMEEFLYGSGEMGGDFYRSTFESRIGVEGSKRGGFARYSTDGSLIIKPSLSPLLNLYGDNDQTLIEKPIFSFNSVVLNNHGTHARFPCQSQQNYRIASGNGLTPIFATEVYEACNIVGFQKTDLSSAGKYGLGMSFDGQDDDEHYKMSITARHPYYEELETKRQELDRLLKLKKNLKEELKIQSRRAVAAVTALQLSDANIQTEQIQEWFEKISKTF